MSKRFGFVVLICSLACGDDSSPSDAGATSDVPGDARTMMDAADAFIDLDGSPTDSAADTPARDTGPVDAGVVESAGLWLSPEEVMALPMSGDAWDNVSDVAAGDWGSADVSDQDNDHDVCTFAGALVAVRTSDDTMRDRVVAAIASAVGTETGARTLALGRQLLAYVLAADLIGYRDAAFVDWLSAIRTRTFPGRAGIDTIYRSATEDPSNWGCHARASSIAVARFLGDDAQLAELAEAFEDYTGRSGDRFSFGELWWQADASSPLAINPVGAMIEGRSVDGVIPDDQRRGGMFAWPPPQENYVWESLQGTTAAAELLRRAGYPAWQWQDQALRRALVWLHDQADFPATGDDRWVPWLVNARYGSDFPAAATGGGGKSVGFTDWTHAP